MQRQRNRSGLVSAMVGLGLLAVLHGLPAAADDWRCRHEQRAGWRCDAADPGALELVPAASAPLPVADAPLAEPTTAVDVGDGGPSPAAPATPLPAPSTDADLASSLWLPRADLPEAEASALPAWCDGTYRTFTYPYPPGTNPDDYPIRTASGSAIYLIDGDVELADGVQLTQGNRTVDAHRVQLDRTAQQALLEGGVRLQEPGMVMAGASGQVNLDTRGATVDDVEFVLLDSAMRGAADSVTQDGAGTLTIRRGTFTRCEPGNNNWRIGAASVRVEEDEVFGTARNAVVRVKRVPVFYTPYIRFPVTDDRQSGLLFPNLAYSSEDGMDVSVPYYLNLAPNYDATLVPRYVGRRGTGLEGEFRHLSGWQESTVSGAYLHRDKLFDGTYDRDDFEELLVTGEVAGEFEPEDRWLFAMDHSGGFGNFATVIDYTAVSDRDYFRDLGSDLGVSSQIDLERRGEIQYAAGGLELRLWSQRFQRLDESPIDPYQRLPEADLNYSGALPGPFEWSLGSSYVSFDRDNQDLLGLNAIVGDRWHIEPRLRMPLSRSWGFLTLAGGYRHTRYDLQDVPLNVDPEPERSIGLGSAHAGLYLERDLNWFGTSLVQTLEPQVYYLYQEFAAQEQLPRFDASELTFGFSQLFRDNRFAGLDRIGDANQVSVGLTSRFVNAVSGQEYLRTSLGVISYLEDRRVTLGGAAGEPEMQSTSAIAGELGFKLASAWSGTGALVYDPHTALWEEGAVALQYRSDARHILNLGYRKRLQGDIQQTDLSLYWPVTRHYAVLGRWNYDVISGRTIEGFGGIEYNDCCWQIRLMARRFLDSPTGRNLESAEADEGIFLQIVFKGLAGFGDKMESVLQRGIRGYRTEAIGYD